MCYKFYREKQELKKVKLQLFVQVMNLMYDENKEGKIDFFYQPSKEVIVP